MFHCLILLEKRMSESKRFAHMFDKSIVLVIKWYEINFDGCLESICIEWSTLISTSF